MGRAEIEIRREESDSALAELEKLLHDLEAHYEELAAASESNDIECDEPWHYTLKHTTGPWETIDGAEVYPTAGAKAYVELCRVNGPWCQSGCYTDKAEAVANGRLIAAAPELLQACLLLDDYWRSGASIDGGSEAADRVRAAVRKAVGGES